MPHIINGLFPSLFQVFKSAEQFSKGMRARACSVVLRALKLAAVSLLDAEPERDVDRECVQLLQHILPNFVEAFAQEISSPLTGNSEGEVLMRIEIVRIFFLVVELQPRLAQGSLPLVVHGLWQALAAVVPVYEQRVVLSSSEDAAPDDTDPFDGHIYIYIIYIYM